MLLIDRGSTLHLRSDDESLQWSFDAGGRFLQGHTDEVHLQLGVSGTLLERRGPRGRHKRRPVAHPPERALPLLTALCKRLATLDLQGDAAQLERLRSWTPARYAAHAARYAQVYRPVPILPPDCYQAVVAQVTEGCSHNACRFCTLYANVPFRVKPPHELETHLASVRELLGPSLALRRSVFLGDANALLIPRDRILAAMERVREALPDQAAGGFYSFVDAFTPPGRTVDELKDLAAAGLRRAYVGLETGNAPLLEALGKPATPHGAAQLVHRLHAAGVSAGVIALVGPGGAAAEDDHVRDTVAAVRAMELGPSDIVYLSPLIPSELSPERLDAQEDRLRQGLSDLACKVATYDLTRWVY